MMEAKSLVIATDSFIDAFEYMLNEFEIPDRERGMMRECLITAFKQGLIDRMKTQTEVNEFTTAYDLKLQQKKDRKKTLN